MSRSPREPIRHTEQQCRDVLNRLEPPRGPVGKPIIQTSEYHGDTEAPQVAAAENDLRQALHRLREQLDVFEKKLVPILRPCQPLLASASDKKPEYVATLCPLAEFIREHLVSVNDLSYRLADLAGRVEV